jgi:hypothetical protein
MNTDFRAPPRTHTSNQTERLVGLELEFTGVEMSTVAQLVVDLFEGSIQQISEFEYEVTDTRYGTFSLELDAQLLKNQTYLNILENLGITLEDPHKQERLEIFLRDLASGLVPYEIVAPPIPWSKLSVFNPLLDQLRSLNAEGTGSSFLHAFGLHINPEIASTHHHYLLRYLQAFVLLEPWIRLDANIDVSRTLTPYIQSFNSDYVTYILKSDYHPSQIKLIRDYLRFGNSRNRSLDMLPIFKYLNAPLVLDYDDDPRISARPAFHYRLPNSSLSDPDWSIADEWNRWVLVEQLAEDEAELRNLAQAFLNRSDRNLSPDDRKWIALVDQWVKHVQ